MIISVHNSDSYISDKDTCTAVLKYIDYIVLGIFYVQRVINRQC